MAFKIGLDEKVTRGSNDSRMQREAEASHILTDWREKVIVKEVKNKVGFVKPKQNIFFHFQSFAVPSFLIGFLCSWALWTRGSALYPYNIIEDGLEHRSSIETVTKGNVRMVFMF